MIISFIKNLVSKFKLRKARKAYLDTISKITTVHNITVSQAWTDHGGRWAEEMSFILLENGLKKRSYKVHSYGYAEIYKSHLKHPYYIQRVFPWLQGMDFDDIPSYWTVTNRNPPNWLAKYLKTDNIYVETEHSTQLESDYQIGGNVVPLRRKNNDPVK